MSYPETNLHIIKTGFYNSQFVYKQMSQSPDRKVEYYELEYFPESGGVSYINGQAYPIGARIANLKSAVSAYIQDIESGDDDDGDEEGDGDYGQGEDYGGGYLHDNLVIDDIGATPPSDPIGFDPPS